MALVTDAGTLVLADNEKLVKIQPLADLEGESVVYYDREKDGHPLIWFDRVYWVQKMNPPCPVREDPTEPDDATPKTLTDILIEQWDKLKSLFFRAMKNISSGRAFLTGRNE